MLPPLKWQSCAQIRAYSWYVFLSFDHEVFGATVALSLRERIRQQLRAEVANKYALNETNTIAVIGDDGIGTLEPDMEIRIVDDLGRDVPPGQPGTVARSTQELVRRI